MTSPAPIVYCARHREVETGLTCGRCGTPICPRCLVHTPGGTRCPDCAMLRRPPMYELALLDYARAIAAAIAVALPLGFVGAFFAPTRFFGLFSMIFVLLGGSGAGTLIAAVLSRATKHKRGTSMQAIAVGAIVLAAVLRFWLSGAPPSMLLRDITGALLVVVAIGVAWNRLR